MECGEKAKSFVVQHEMGTTVVVASDFAELFSVFGEWWRTCQDCEDDSDAEIMRHVYNVQVIDDGGVLIADHLLPLPTARSADAAE